MDILTWIDVGEVAAERDELLGSYFFDNGVLRNVINKPSAFLILGRKGAGKTAVFKHLSANYRDFIGKDNILISLSLEDYNWNVHALLKRAESADSLTYRQSWRFVILVEVVKAYTQALEVAKQQVPSSLYSAKKLLEKLFNEPIPSISTIIGRKLLDLSKFSLPSGSLNFDDGNFDSIKAGGGEVSFDEIKKSPTLQDALSRNIENVINFLERALETDGQLKRKVYVIFDRVDEAWDEISFEKSQGVIAGLVGAADFINSKYKGQLRPIVFLREDIFETISLNDKNKLREDCGALLHWSRESLSKLILSRLNYFGAKAGIAPILDIDTLFDKAEMRQRLRPSNYILKRTMMRPRDVICYLRRIINNMKERAADPFVEQPVLFDSLSTESIYDAEPGYSEWLWRELLDEWKVQKPIIKNLFTAIESNGSTNINVDDLIEEMKKLNEKISRVEAVGYLRFLFENSIVGFKAGEQNYWRFRCFYPTQGFIEAPEYRVHDALVRVLNLKEPRA